MTRNPGLSVLPHMSLPPQVRIVLVGFLKQSVCQHECRYFPRAPWPYKHPPKRTDVLQTRRLHVVADVPTAVGTGDRFAAGTGNRFHRNAQSKTGRSSTAGSAAGARPPAGLPSRRAGRSSQQPVQSPCHRARSQAVRNARLRATSSNPSSGSDCSSRSDAVRRTDPCQPRAGKP